MANRGYGYQYETSPRKLEPEYRKVPVKKKNAPKKVTQNVKKKTKQKSKKKVKMSFEAKFFINSMLFFALIFAMIACQALVEQRYKEKESLKQEYNELLAHSKISNELNDDTRMLASQYGMQTKSATLIDLETTDYIESATNKVETKEGFFEKIINWINDIF